MLLEEEDDDIDEDVGDVMDEEEEEEEEEGCGAVGAFFLKSAADIVPAATAAGTCVVNPNNPQSPDDGIATFASTSSFAGCKACVKDVANANRSSK